MTKPDAFKWGGRIGRLRYVAYLLCTVAGAMAITALLSVIPEGLPAVGTIGSGVLWIAVFYLLLAILVRRARDVGLSAKLSMTVFLGFGFVCMAADRGSNTLTKEWYATFVTLLAVWPGKRQPSGTALDASNDNATNARMTKAVTFPVALGREESSEDTSSR